jgi:hypothetical protein
MQFKGKISNVRIERDLNPVSRGTLFLTVAIDFPTDFAGELKQGETVTVTSERLLPSILEPALLVVKTRRAIRFTDE